MSRHANLPFSNIAVNSGDTFNDGSTPFTDLSALNDGTIAFTKEDGSSVTAAEIAADPNLRFHVVKVHKVGTTVTFDKTLNSIQAKKIRSITVSPIAAGQNQIVEVSATSLTCNTDYLLKVVINAPYYFTEYGYQPKFKTYNLNSGCCAPCEGCGDSDCKEFWISFKDSINADQDELVTATLVDGDGELLNDAAVRALGDGICPLMRLEFSPSALRTFCDIPDVYAYPNCVNVDVVGLGGFSCNSTITTVQEMCCKQFSGIDVAERQFASEGYTGGGIFRRADSGARMGTSKLDVDKTASYAAISIEWDGVTEEGFQVYQNPAQHTFWISSAEELDAGADLVTFLDAAFGTAIGDVDLTQTCPSVTEFNVKAPYVAAIAQQVIDDQA